MTKLLVLLVLASLMIEPRAAYAQAGAAVELGGTLIALQQMKAALESALNTADLETAAKIRQVEIVLDETIKKVKDAMDHGYGLFSNTRDQVMGNIADMMVQSQQMLQDDVSVALVGVNDSLVNVARIMTAIPGINVPTYIFAISPQRIQPDAVDRHIEIHGFFPDVSKEHPVKVRFDNGGSELQLDKFVNNSLAVDLPAKSISEEAKFITLTFDLPVKHLGGVYYTVDSVKARIYVERAKPYTFTVKVNVGNPELWKTVDASEPLVERADSNRTTNSQTFTAPDLFARLINDNVHYDMSTAEFVSISGIKRVPVPPTTAVGGGFLSKVIGVAIAAATGPFMDIKVDPIEQGENPCASGCTASSGSWTWSPSSLSINLSAPSCSTHLVSPGGLQIPYQCGGGTHADFRGFISFRVQQRGMQQQPEVQSLDVTFSQSRKKVSDPTNLPSNWTSIDVIGRYQDGKDSIERHSRLTGGPNGLMSGNQMLWAIEVSGTSLIITTR